LFRALQVALQSSGIDCQELATAVARLKALFPREFAPFLDQMTMRPVVLSARKSHRQRMLMLLNQAWIESRKIEMVYETRSRGGARSERVVHPYHVVPYVRSWHMIAYCELRENVLVFKVDRIRSATLLESAFKIPKDFDLERYMGCTWGMMRCEDGADPVDIVLRFEPEAGHWVGEEDWHPSQKVEELSDGSVLFRLRLVITPEFVNWLLYYGNRVKVLEPENLKDQVIEEHRKAMDEY